MKSSNNYDLLIWLPVTLSYTTATYSRMAKYSLNIQMGPFR
ncbi:hypothetical protein SAMN05444008_101194 [Cnuella takakiae]|uniref:Uncharacterized protein n=1 Tax=Cnuella takakiae TaxID=1302690 RepID=A0A1M4SPS0_9BACT|nr:hypothetical protein SAMN05444008_101194 [Cnuella takakiae]